LGFSHAAAVEASRTDDGTDEGKDNVDVNGANPNLELCLKQVQ